MKKMIFTALLLLSISSVLMSRELVAEGKTNSAFGNFRIEIADYPVILNGEQLKTYIISYQNSPLEVTVVIRKDKKCKNYIVLSDKLSVQYVCNGKFFGIQLLDKEFEKEGYSTSVESLNKSEYFCQKVITLGENSELDNAMLIASYFPKLIKSSEEVLATR